MAKLGTYGDHITLQRAAELYHVQIVVLSSIGPLGTRVISPYDRYSNSLPTLVLGHFAEGEGEHYISLRGPVQQYLVEADIDLENNNLELNKEDAAPPMHRCDWPSEVNSTEKDMELQNASQESNKEDAAPPMQRCDWPSDVIDVIATDEDMELQNASQESNSDDSARTMHLCDLPDEMIVIIFQYVFSIGVFNIGAVRYAWNKSQRVQRIVGNCLSKYTVHICADILKKLEGDLIFTAGITCEWSISRLVRLAGKSSGSALRQRSFFRVTQAGTMLK